jgi:cycloartenol synthase
MWRLVCSKGNLDGDGSGSGLSSLNEFVGRQTWEYVVATEDNEDEIVKQDERRKEFRERRFSERHSKDAIMRDMFDRERVERKREMKTKAPTANDGFVDELNAIDDDYEKLVLKSKIAVRAGVEYYQGQQHADGHWPSDYGGPMFLMPGLIIAMKIMKKEKEMLPEHVKVEMIRYLENHVNEDGGVGLHIEGHSTMFGSVLTFVALRCLGEELKTSKTLRKMQEWIKTRGGATKTPSWGKFWLSMLGCYEWKGLNPIPPECWLLPYWFPAHPGRYWCHCRMVYLPMSYLYGKRAQIEKGNPISEALKTELYCQEYDTIDWNKARNECASEDLYYPHPFMQNLLWSALSKVEPVLLRSPLRRWANNEALKHVIYEDENTRYVDIGPVNKVFNCLCRYFSGDEEGVNKHLPRFWDYLWVAEDGMKMQGYNGSQLWDCAFAVQAIECTGISQDFNECLRDAAKYIDDSQVRDDAPEMKKYYRHISKGAWPFSTRDHGWPISDCSSEGLKAALSLMDMEDQGLIKIDEMNRISVDRLADCVNVILSYQNTQKFGFKPQGSGGWATYENTRAGKWVEILNPAETFGDIMIDYPYVECSSASIQAITKFAKRFPNHPIVPRIEKARESGRSFLKSIQKEDGSWYGSWAICFTYGTWFGVLGLIATGSTYETCPHLRKAVKFLLSKQQETTGGWGESYLSCEKKTYHQLYENKDGNTEFAHCVNTSWAMLALIATGQEKRDRAPLLKAAKCLLKKQLPNGDWPQENIMGVFNNNCMITYANYKNIFPLWALGKFNNNK